MQINRFRCHVGRAGQVPLFRNHPSEPTGARANHAVPVLEIQHVGIPRMLPLAVGGVSAQEVLLPSLEEESEW